MSNTIKHCLTSTESVSPLYLVQVKIWRRSFDVPPPPMEPGHEFYDVIRNDPRYKVRIDHCPTYHYIYTLCTKFSTPGRSHGRRVPELRVPEADHREDAAILERGHRAPAQGRNLSHTNSFPNSKPTSFKCHTQSIYHDDHQIYFLLLPGRQEYPSGSPR